MNSPKIVEQSEKIDDQECNKSLHAKVQWILERVLFSLACFWGIYAFSLIPKESRFEARINSRFIHFSNTEEALLFNSIADVDNLSIAGKHDILLPGKFVVKDPLLLSPEQRLKLSNLESQEYLTFRLSSTNSHLALASLGQADTLEIEEIRLKETDINNRLSYNFCSFSDSDEVEEDMEVNSCRHFFQLATSIKNEKIDHYISVDIDTNRDSKFILQVNGSSIPELQLLDVEMLEFEYYPASKIPTISFSNTVEVSFNISDEKSFNPSSWFAKGLAVNNVSFQELRTSAIDTPAIESGLLGGVVDFIGQELATEENQFISLKENHVDVITTFDINSAEKS